MLFSLNRNAFIGIQWIRRANGELSQACSFLLSIPFKLWLEAENGSEEVALTCRCCWSSLPVAPSGWQRPPPEPAESPSSWLHACIHRLQVQSRGPSSMPSPSPSPNAEKERKKESLRWSQETRTPPTLVDQIEFCFFHYFGGRGFFLSYGDGSSRGSHFPIVSELFMLSVGTVLACLRYLYLRHKFWVVQTDDTHIRQFES